MLTIRNITQQARYCKIISRQFSGSTWSKFSWRKYFFRNSSSEFMSAEWCAHFLLTLWRHDKILTLMCGVVIYKLWPNDTKKPEDPDKSKFKTLQANVGNIMKVPTERRVSDTYVDRTITQKIGELFKIGKNIVVLRGFGGYGKTQLALNFADMNKNDYPVIIFIECPANDKKIAEQDAWLENILNNTDKLSITKIKERISQALSNAQQKLTGNPKATTTLRNNESFASLLDELNKVMEASGYKALVIIDNVDLRLAWDKLYPWIGKSTTYIHYLITSRIPPESRDNKATSTPTVKLRDQKLEVISVDGFTISEAQQYIKQYLAEANKMRAGVSPSIILTDQQINQLCTVSKCIPLALKILLKNIVSKIRNEGWQEQNEIMQHIFEIYASYNWADLIQQLDLLKTSIEDYAAPVLTNPNIDPATMRYATNTYNVSVEELKKSVAPRISSDAIDDLLLLYSLCGDVYISSKVAFKIIKELDQNSQLYATLTKLTWNDINIINAELVNNGLGRSGPNGTGVTIDYLMKASIRYNLLQHMLAQVPPIVTSKKSGGLFGWFATTTITKKVDLAQQKEAYESFSAAAKQITTQCCTTTDPREEHLTQELVMSLLLYSVACVFLFNLNNRRIISHIKY